MPLPYNSVLSKLPHKLKLEILICLQYSSIIFPATVL